MGSDTKSGPSIAAALHETGLQDVAAAITPVFQCNSPNQFRTAVSIQQPIGNDGQQRMGEGLAAGDVRGGGGGALNIASTPMSLPPEITPSLNARGPAGANGHQFPTVDPRFSSVPGGSGTGAFFGSNTGVARSPEFGGASSGDFSINNSGGIDVSVSSGGQPATTVDHGAHPDITPLGGGKKAPVVHDPGGAGGGGGSAGPGGADIPGDPIDDPPEDGPIDEGGDCSSDSPCDTTIDGSLCVTKIFADNIHLRWGTTMNDIEGPKKCGPVEIEAVGDICAATSGDGSGDGAGSDDSGKSSDSKNATPADNDGKDLPPCPDNQPGRDGGEEAGAKDESDPGSGDARALSSRGDGGGEGETGVIQAEVH